MRGVGALLAGGAWIAAMASPAGAQDVAVAQAMARGTELLRYDRAAWVTSDDMEVRVPQDRRTEITGWIVVPVRDGLHVYWHRTDDAANSIVYEADVVGDRVSNAVVHPKAEAPGLPPLALRMADALRVAKKALSQHRDWRPCTDARFNTVVLPPQPDGSIAVYFLTAQTVSGSYPFGGHFEIVVAADGSIRSSRRFTKACFNMAPVPNTAALAMSHVLDPQPTEIHVFEQFATGLPLFVSTEPGGRVWLVRDGEITPVDTPK